MWRFVVDCVFEVVLCEWLCEVDKDWMAIV